MPHILGNSKLKVISTDQIFIFLGEGGVLWTKLNPKFWPLWQFSFSRGGGYSGPSQTRSPNLSDNFHFQGRVEVGTLDTTFLKYLSGGTGGIFNTKFHKPKLGPATLCVETNEHEPSDDNKGINDNKLNKLSLRKRGTLPKMLSLTTRKMTMQKNRHLTAMHPHQSCLL